MPKKSTVEEARLILELYNLRREPELRKARQWWLTTFWPSCADDFMKVAMDFGWQENNCSLSRLSAANCISCLPKSARSYRRSAKKPRTPISFCFPKRPFSAQSKGARNLKRLKLA